MARYKYTCPDVVHYRKNQYRLAIWSNVLSIGYIAAFFGGLAYLGKKYNNPTPVETPEKTEE